MIARVPAAFFGIVLGLAGLGNAWRLAVRLWSYPPWIGEAILLLATIVWLTLVLLYAAKWVFTPAQAQAEARDAVQCCYIGLAPASTMLIAIAVTPYYQSLALALFVAGALGTLLFAIWRTGVLWQGARDPAHTTPVLYLPTVAGCFITASAAAALGLEGWGAPFFGAGFFTWLAIDSVLLHRLYTAAPVHGPLRPTLGIQLAPPTVGTVALLTIPDAPVLLAEMMLGYGIVQAAVIARLLPWIGRHGFSAGFWAFSFGLDALAFSLMRLQQLGVRGPLLQAAWPGFLLANAVVSTLAIGTLWLLLRGRLVPPAAARLADEPAADPEQAAGAPGVSPLR